MRREVELQMTGDEIGSDRAAVQARVSNMHAVAVLGGLLAEDLDRPSFERDDQGAEERIGEGGLH